MKIAICDDNRADGRALQQILVQLQPDSEIKRFAGGADLLEAMRAGERFACLFLDILMPGIDGMKLASAIRREFSDETIQLIFTTVSRDYALEAFGKNAVHYLVKPVRREDVAEALLCHSCSKNAPFMHNRLTIIGNYGILGSMQIRVGRQVSS